MAESALRSERRTLRVDGEERVYMLVEPANPPAGPRPLVLTFHGSGGSPAAQIGLSASDTLVHRHGATVVAPQGAIPFRVFPGFPDGWAWNIPDAPLPGEPTPRSGGDDVAFAAALIEEVSHITDVDRTRVYAKGFSGGARLCALLAAQLPDRLAAVACVAGLRCPEAVGPRSPRMLGIHGLADPVNPFAGGLGPRWSEPVDVAAQRWAEARGCVAPPLSQSFGAGIEELAFRCGDDPRGVVLVTVAEGGHTWPGSTDSLHRRLGVVSAQLDATAYIWRFFEGASATAGSR